MTVCAPTNSVFTQLAVDLGFDGDTSDEDTVFASLVDSLTVLGNGDPIPPLLDVLLYHVSTGDRTVEELNDLDVVRTIGTEQFRADGNELIDSDPDAENPTVVLADVQVANGFVQVIDQVLRPFDLPAPDAGGDDSNPVETSDNAPTLAGIVAASGGAFDNNDQDFDILLNAVQAAGLADALDDPNADLTVFAPNDAAFIGLAQTLGFEGKDEGDAFAYIVESLKLLSGGGDPIRLLKDILLYHVAPGSLDSTDVMNADQIETLLGETLGVNGLSLVDNDPDIIDPELIATDIQASNGIAHVIDGVLIPADILNGDGGRGRVDFIIGDDTDEDFRTSSNTDFVSGLGGDDDIRLGNGDDVGLGGNGDDMLRGNRGEDILDGGNGADMLFGGRGSDMVNAGAGNDEISGGRGNDMLTGGDGSDAFLFNNNSGSDVITDFVTGEDILELNLRRLDDAEDALGYFQDTDEGALFQYRNVEILLEDVEVASLSQDDFLIS